MILNYVQEECYGELEQELDTTANLYTRSKRPHNFARLHQKTQNLHHQKTQNLHQKTQNLHYAVLCQSKQQLMRPISGAERLGNTAPKKRHSHDEPLPTVTTILPAGESNPRPTAPNSDVPKQLS